MKAVELIYGVGLAAFMVGNVLIVREKMQQAYSVGLSHAPQSMTAAVNESAEQQPTAEQNPVTNSGSMSSQPAETEVNESPPVVETWLALPPVFTDYTTAALEATNARELLVVLHPGYSLDRQARVHRNIAKTPGSERFVLLLLDADATIKGQRAQDYFGASHPTSTIRHNPVTGESKPVRAKEDLEN